MILTPDQSNKKTILGKVQNGKIYPLSYKKSYPYGIKSRNVGQYFMQEALMASADEIPLVIIKGMAGTAKTFYSLAVGLEKVFNNPTGEYRRIIVCRPNAQFDDEIGFLPGSEQEKIAPLMRPVIDNLEQILDSDEEERYADEKALADKVQEIFERGIIQTEALNFIRGRSIAKTYLIIDEAQNMTPNQVRGIITRAGKGTKIILLGDPCRLTVFLDEQTNEFPKLCGKIHAGKSVLCAAHIIGGRMRAVGTCNGCGETVVEDLRTLRHICNIFVCGRSCRNYLHITEEGFRKWHRYYTKTSSRTKR